MNGQKLLDNAIFYERRKNWKKTILFYNELFVLFKDDAFTKLDKHAPEELKILKFQCYYHCAVAHQNLKDHNIAISTFQQAIRTVEKRKVFFNSNAGSRRDDSCWISRKKSLELIELSSINKNGCSSGCVTGSEAYWSVPAYTRKALSQIYLGNLQEALQSSEKVALLDSANPDMYCIRAMVRFLLGDKVKATADVVRALKFNPNHACALIVRGWLENSEKMSPLSMYGIETLHKSRKWNRFEEKAYELNPSIVAYFGLPDKTEKILEVLDKYLPTVRCPHTITVYDVLQIAQGNSSPEKKGYSIARRTTTTNSAVVTRQTSTSVASNHSISSMSEMDQVSQKGRTFSSTSTSQRNVPFAKTFSKTDLTEAGQRKISKETRKELSECCKGCSSVEEFLKHLIWSEETTSMM